MTTGSYFSVIILNVNGLNAPTKRQRLVEWIKKQDPYICYLQETHLKTRDTYRLKAKDWKKDISRQWRPKESRSSNTHIRWNRLWNKGCEKRQWRTLHNDQRINLKRRYNNYYTTTIYMKPTYNTAVCKANANKYERGS